MQRKNCTIFYTPWHASREQSVLLEIRRRSSGKSKTKKGNKVEGRGNSKGFFQRRVCFEKWKGLRIQEQAANGSQLSWPKQLLARSFAQ